MFSVVKFLLLQPSVFLPSHRLHLSQQIPKLAVVDLDPVIQVQADALVCVVAQELVELAELFLLLAHGVQLFLHLVPHAGGAGIVSFLLQVFDPGLVFALQRSDVHGPHTGQGGFIVAVQIDQALEGLVLAAGKQPVDGPLLVYFQVVVLEELVADVAADGIYGFFTLLGTQAVGYNLQVLVQGLRRPGNLDELHKPVGGVVCKPVLVHDRDDPVLVSREGLIPAGIKALIAAVGVDQSRLIQRVAAHHAPDGIGDGIRSGGGNNVDTTRHCEESSTGVCAEAISKNIAH